MAKGEIARFEQFLLLSLCLQTPSAAEATEGVRKRLLQRRQKASVCWTWLIHTLLSTELGKEVETLT